MILRIRAHCSYITSLSAWAILYACPNGRMLASLLSGVPEYDKLGVPNRLGVPVKEAGEDIDWFGMPRVPEVLLVDSTNDILWYGAFSLFRMSFKISCLKKQEEHHIWIVHNLFKYFKLKYK